MAWGLYDFERVLEAPWVGFPASEWPGFDLSFNATFWSLLPGFVIVIMATTINSISDTVAIQQVAWRRPRATDFRVVQGAHNLLALTNLFAAAIRALQYDWRIEFGADNLLIRRRPRRIAEFMERMINS